METSIALFTTATIATIVYFRQFNKTFGISLFKALNTRYQKWSTVIFMALMAYSFYAQWTTFINSVSIFYIIACIAGIIMFRAINFNK